MGGAPYGGGGLGYSLHGSARGNGGPMQNFPSMPAAIPMFKSKSGMSSISVSNLEIEIGDFVDDFAEDANAEDLDFPDGFAADDMPRSADPSREGLDPSARRSAGDVRSGDVSGDGNGRLDSRAASNATGNSRDHEVAPTPCTNEVVVRVVEFRTGGIERTNTSASLGYLRPRLSLAWPRPTPFPLDGPLVTQVFHPTAIPLRLPTCFGPTHRRTTSGAQCNHLSPPKTNR